MKATVWIWLEAALLAVAFCGLMGLLFWLTGCASMYQKCSYHPDGRLSTYRIRSTVIGTGETEVVTSDCAALAYSTRDTGISDNGKQAVGEISEGVARAMLPLP